ncbi:DUF1266 domain-containing protein [Lachnospiraceae bacterium 47-T17]
MKKKVLSVILAVVFVCSMAGCGGGNDAAGDKAKDEGAAGDSSDASEDDGDDAAAISDTVLWFNGTWAVLGSINEFDYESYPGYEMNQTTKVLQQESLKQSWDVTDTESAQETMAWLMDEGGHRGDYIEEMEYLEECGITDAADGNYKDWMLENFDLGEDDPEGQAQSYADAYTFYTEHSESGIAAWDYSRAMSLCAFYYIAGYYTETEALDKSMEIAEKAQKEFSSWDDFYDSYFAGYEYWAQESSDDRRAIYEGIKVDENSPFKLDWNLTFEKTW